MSGVEIRMVREAMGGVSVACNVAPLACNEVSILLSVYYQSAYMHLMDRSDGRPWTGMDYAYILASIRIATLVVRVHHDVFRY